MIQSPQRGAARLTPSLHASTILPSPELARIVARRAISIPFGFESSLTLLDAGQHILAKGHGGCEAGQIATVDVEIIQATSGVTATGQTQSVCTGELQQWSATVEATQPDRLVPGPARACGVATTRANGQLTDTFQWCRDVTLVVQIYLPVVSRE
jgi:hypothetical protein